MKKISPPEIKINLWRLPASILRISLTLIISLAIIIGFTPQAWAFCGFYVAKADTKLYNQASQVVIARDRDRTILTMANDYQGDVKDFALVVPVPVVLTEDQVHIGDPKIIQRLDAFSAPRLVEYFDSDPCAPPVAFLARPAAGNRATGNRAQIEDEALGVTVEERFTVGEYDIVILSAKESNGLETWLRRNDYRIPQGANRLLRPYIRQKMKFFVAKVNLQEFEKADYQKLRPLMMAYESRKFMLPIRLGMINSTKEQDLIVYILSPQGQAEITNYRTVKIPSNTELPVFVKKEFTDFYKAMFQTAYEQEDKKVAFLEYAWDMGWCDPCADNPLTPEELKKAGVFWLNSSRGTNVFITRLHVRYTRNKFPEDLMFQETSNRQNFQGRYVLRHPYEGEMDCPAGEEYQQSLNKRFEQEAQTLAKLTGWKLRDIRQKINFTQSQPTPWWRSVWD
ncbi:MAG: DUF2330 domain-containing protein [Symploca sp. SIO2E6]|nr:DUF2330 domain-containing protein [Symploca sp. SIO2E6]